MLITDNHSFNVGFTLFQGRETNSVYSVQAVVLYRLVDIDYQLDLSHCQDSFENNSHLPFVLFKGTYKTTA
ncbi:hypothetical protein [Pseudoalteromonas sp. H105]|uniref:hypothetical protein n=1 Tax=Pseudoalteromonas sp. H105 TaxID=1348393 RepID=UPI00073219DA|nr:hypothetical protein [Pseudoalteromonas sp. H105]KTF13714.1 hypothetical protein ATS75_14175 [Pseudoalteromonas sp. H105]